MRIVRNRVFANAIDWRLFMNCDFFAIVQDSKKPILIDILNLSIKCGIGTPSDL